MVLLFGPSYSWAFSIATGHKRARGSQRFHGRSLCALARGMQLGPFNVTYFTPQSACQTNTLICTHPVHCDPCVSRGAPRERGLPANTPPSLFRRRVLWNRPCSSLLYRPSCLHLLRLFLLAFRFGFFYFSTIAKAVGGGSGDRVYLPGENHIGSGYETFDIP